MRRPLIQFVVAVAAIVIVAGIVYAGGDREFGDTGALAPFSVVKLSVPGRVEILQSEGHTIRVSGPEPTVNSIDIFVRDHVLHIERRRWTIGRDLDDLVFTVSAPVIDELVTSSSGDIHADGLSSETITLRTSSSGDIVIDRLRADELRVRMSSSGDVTTSGSAQLLNLRVSSSGDFRGRNLRATDVVVDLSSSGDARVHASDTLEGRVSSGGDLVYYGAPRSVQVNTSSSGTARPGE